MALIGYQKRFAELVETGQKLQTVRKNRTRPIRVGDPLFHHVGLRTKNCRKLGESICTGVKKVSINEHGRLVIDGGIVAENGRERFARADGFGGWEEMLLWIQRTHGLPFYGQVILWADIVGQVRVGSGDSRKIKCPKCGVMVRWANRAAHECCKDHMNNSMAKIGGMERAEKVSHRYVGMPHV